MRAFSGRRADRARRRGMDGRRLRGRSLAPGQATGMALVLDEPLSFWGGMDPRTGRITEARHPQRGALLTGRVVVMPGGRGSSSSASVLAEAVRAGTAPAAIVLGEPDLILAIGAAVAEELYGTRIPIVLLSRRQRRHLADGTRVALDDGRVQVAEVASQSGDIGLD
jgi:predicted aconitase with swiveling domain